MNDFRHRRHRVISQHQNVLLATWSNQRSPWTTTRCCRQRIHHILASAHRCTFRGVIRRHGGTVADHPDDGNCITTRARYNRNADERTSITIFYNRPEIGHGNPRGNGKLHVFPLGDTENIRKPSQPAMAIRTCFRSTDQSIDWPRQLPIREQENLSNALTDECCRITPPNGEKRIRSSAKTIESTPFE